MVRTLEHQRHSHSYRHELETYFHALEDADAILKLPHRITQRMDCKGGLDKIEAPIYTPKDTMGSDMDIVMAYKALQDQSKHTVSHEWVMGHADEKKKDKPETISPMETENIGCDKGANARVDENVKPKPFTPLPGYKAMLKLGDDWVTTLFRDCVKFANVAPDAVEYALGRLDISLSTFHSINWGAVGRVRKSHRIARRVRISKMMYRWLPVGHNWQKCKLPSDKCPCCGAKDETFEHLLSCEHKDLVSIRADGCRKIRLDCEALELPLHFTSTLLSVINSVFGNGDVPITFKTESLRKAVESQQKVGLYNMVVGFVSTGWTDALRDMKVEHPETMMEQVLAMLWDHICENVWNTRNGILHSNKSMVTQDEMTSLEDQLYWFQRHQNEVLDYRHQFLTDFTAEEVSRWSRATRRAKINMLKNAQRYYATECKQKAANQSTIFDWLHSYTTLRSGRLVGDGLNNAWVQGTKPSCDDAMYDSDSTCEAEFDWDPTPQL